MEVLLIFVGIFVWGAAYTYWQKQRDELYDMHQKIDKIRQNLDTLLREIFAEFRKESEAENKALEKRLEKKLLKVQRQTQKQLAALQNQHESCLSKDLVNTTFPVPKNTAMEKKSLDLNPHASFLKKIKSDRAPLYFVMGSAGTGKTYFIHQTQQWMQENKLNAITLAYTGVAALEAKGQTIHFFCKFPTHYIRPDDIKKTYDQNIIRQADLIIIDEISMVSANIMDSMDKFFKVNRGNDSFFGGLTVLLVGDLFQLPPVIRPIDKENHKADGYHNGFFFNSFCMQDQRDMTTKELTASFRHKDPAFSKILDSVRFARNIKSVLPVINSRHLPQEGHELHLTTTRKLANEKNMREITAIKEPLWAYEGEIKGVFPQKDNLPSPKNLELKVGAQVIFTKNDRAKRWVNGSLGIVEELDLHHAFVRLLKNDEVVQVIPETWENITVEYRNGQFEKKVLGEYIQLPLMLAWAMTIHKSQGKTIDRVHVNLGRGAFVPGQTYVALSRVREMEHLRLARPLRQDDIFIDKNVYTYYQEAFPREALI